MEAEAAMAITPSILIKSMSYTGSTEGSILKLTVQVLPELFLGTIKLIKGVSAASSAGTFKKGTSAKAPGLAEITISAELYDSLYAAALASTKMAVELEYNATRCTVSNVYIENV